jgi:zinc/manganese transport system ATP-binding protein
VHSCTVEGVRADGSIVLRDVTVRYGSRIALDGVSGEFRAGSLTAVIGANGAGKSTLLAAVAGTTRLARGSIERSAGSLAYLPQRSSIDTNFPIPVAELIMLGAWCEFGAFRAPRRATWSRLAAAADVVGLTGRLERRIDELSVGELQRALFVRLILQDAATILLDEPLAAVDEPTAEVLLQQMMRWHQDGRTVIAVLHDLDMVRRWFPAAVVLARRCIAWGPTEAAMATEGA